MSHERDDFFNPLVLDLCVRASGKPRSLRPTSFSVSYYGDSPLEHRAVQLTCSRALTNRISETLPRSPQLSVTASTLEELT